MKKPPDPLFFLPQPTLVNTDQLFCLSSVSLPDFLSHLVDSRFRSHLCFASCETLSLLERNWLPLKSYPPVFPRGIKKSPDPPPPPCTTCLFDFPKSLNSFSGWPYGTIIESICFSPLMSLTSFCLII